MYTKNKKRPLTPSLRFYEPNKQMDLDKNEPERKLTVSRHCKKGRNVYGRITSRRRGGGHKRLYRVIDFKRDKFDVPGIVTSIQYDPYRSANIALIVYRDGEKRYILAPKTLKKGDEVCSYQGKVDEYKPGISLLLQHIPPATMIHAVEFIPGRGAQIGRSAGNAVQMISVENDEALLKMPSGEIRVVNAKCRATIGEVGNQSHGNRKLGKAGRNRWLRRRPRVRGVAMNPVDHPMGGGQGKTSGGGHPVSPWGKLAKSGHATRKRSKPSNAQILVRRNGKKVKKGKKG